jgi:predicted N-formylglutamate amidohydrolase
MLKQSSNTITCDHVPYQADDGFVSHVVVPGDLSKGVILLCDHARNTLPPAYGDLGLPASEFTRHIAFDIGVEAITLGLAERLGLPALTTRYSRLLIDPNRGLEDPTLIMKISDGAIVPGNAHISDEERQLRIERYYNPYHDAITQMIAQVFDAGIVPALLSIHSFTAHWKGVLRPWHAGVLWDYSDRRMSDPLIAGLRCDRSLVVGDNEPYSGGLPGDTMNRHGTKRGLAHALLEIRQDLIAHQRGIDEWTDRLADILPDIVALPVLHRAPLKVGGKR